MTQGAPQPDRGDFGRGNADTGQDTQANDARPQWPDTLEHQPSLPSRPQLRRMTAAIRGPAASAIPTSWERIEWTIGRSATAIWTTPVGGGQRWQVFRRPSSVLHIPHRHCDPTGKSFGTHRLSRRPSQNPDGRAPPCRNPSPPSIYSLPRCVRHATEGGDHSHDIELLTIRAS